MFDLLNLTGEVLRLGYAAESKTVFVQGQVLVECDGPADVMAVVQEGHRNRTVGSHELNKDSSRSHSILQLSLDRYVLDGETGATVVSRSKVMFVDLAGSERLKRSQSEGATAVESRYINKSLSTLGKVIAALSDPRARAQKTLGGGRDMTQRPSPADVFIPYRESMLTRLLQDSLGGTALTLMLACVSPAAAYLQESLMTLSYATRASRIENIPIVRVDSKDAVMMAMKREVHHLRAENRAMREKLSLPQEGAILEILASMPVLVPADAVLVQQRQEAPTEEAGQQTEPLHPSHLAPRLPVRMAVAAEDGVGKGRQLGRVRSRFASGNSTGGGGGSSGGLEGGGASSSSTGTSTGSGSGGGGTTLRITPGGIAIVTEGGEGLSTMQPPPGRGNGGAAAQRLADRSADRSSKQLIMDLQQGELAVLSEERDTLRTKHAAALARMAVLTGTLEEQKGAIKRLEAGLEEAKRAKLEAERGMQQVLVGASAAGWPLPFPLAPPLGPAAPGVVPLAGGGVYATAEGGALEQQQQQAMMQLAALQQQQQQLEQEAAAAQQRQHFLSSPGQQQQQQLFYQQQQRGGGGGGFAGSPKLGFPVGAGARAAYGLSPSGGGR